ncbi:MAG: hypothetical protein WDN46_11550 [Methylocella sp.]
MKTVFLRILEAEDKANALREAIDKPDEAFGKQRFEVETTSFSAIPSSPFAYWVSQKLRQSFKELPPFETDERTTKQGLATADDFRFVRCWWAVTPRHVSQRWFPFAKGGKFSPFYADVYLMANWDCGGEEIKNNLNEQGVVRSNVWMLRDTAANFFFRPGLTWPRRTNGLSLRAMPAGCIFADKGPSAFVKNDNTDDLLALAAITNSSAFALLVSLQLARTELAQSYEVGLIQRTPIPRLDSTDRSTLARLARRAWALKRSLDSRTEMSLAFILPALLVVEGDAIAERASAYAETAAIIKSEVMSIQDEINHRCFDLYGIDESDRGSITRGLGTDVLNPAETENDPDVDADADTEENGDSGGNADTVSLAAELVSWAVGVAFGRFDVRLATDARSLPTEPEPFDPLPVCSPAMLTGHDGLPLASAPAGYPVACPQNGILVDDRGHAHDLTTAVHLVFDVVFKASADEWWREVGAVLDPKGHDLGAWVASSFFEHHLKCYSKSRRKAPILWQLSVPSGRYSIWLYAHRLTPDSFFQIQNEVVAAKLAHEERQLTSLVQGLGANPSAKERKEIAAQGAFVEELRSFLDEVKRVAPLWNPTLDDGVVLTMAPLWRLVPQHKPWQRELKSKWDDLAAGKYDWSHVAMHLWPERVVSKCAKDRSLAIAHNLENVFWVEADDGKRKPRLTSTRPADEIVHELTSVAVKAALKELTEASVPNGPKARTRRSSS